MATHDRPPSRLRWRTVDIVVLATVGAVFGLVFWIWNLTFAAVSGVFAVFPPSQAVMTGVWLLPAVLGGLIARRPGAALFCEVAAAVVSVLLGSVGGMAIILLGFAQGAGAEAVFAATGYRRWGTGAAMAAGVCAGATTTLYTLVTAYPTWPLSFMLAFGALTAVSGAVLAGGGSVLLHKALTRTGALASFRTAPGGAR
ncbi:energy-coupling factor transport system substrate-specific component [Murinocardiopsis flavida]|uniref:Energy-coupling factor transport system substrate-specific component n=1 Tax=Murinocardiopsis flavida TaxID=645275 RepID=A0A2P8DJT4_9ACTN|nr:ECF transporter S component [Murinocardiopsis flavida]PSK97480.1 energy-coupling factor transport system substrate-specific component [Murinocardiopsis flavida]